MSINMIQRSTAQKKTFVSFDSDDTLVFNLSGNRENRRLGRGRKNTPSSTTNTYSINDFPSLAMHQRPDVNTAKRHSKSWSSVAGSTVSIKTPLSSSTKKEEEKEETKETKETKEEEKPERIAEKKKKVKKVKKQTNDILTINVNNRMPKKVPVEKVAKLQPIIENTAESKYDFEMPSFMVWGDTNGNEGVDWADCPTFYENDKTHKIVSSATNEDPCIWW